MRTPARRDPWADLHKRALGMVDDDGQEPDHLPDADDRDAGDAHRVAQRTGAIEDSRRQAAGLRGGAPPVHDRDGFAGRIPDGHGDGTGNDVPLSPGQARPLYTTDLARGVIASSPWERTLVEHARARVARSRRRSRGR